jgi:hypothetical protein
MATIALEVVPFLAYAPFPTFLIFFKCILKFVFCEDVQHRLRFCLDHLNCDKMAAFQFYVQSGQQRKVGWMEDKSHIVFGQKFPGKKGSVRRCIVVMQQPVLLSPKFGTKSSTFSGSGRKTSEKCTELTLWPTRTNSLRTIPLMSNKMMSMLLTLLFTCLAFFGLGEF